MTRKPKTLGETLREARERAKLTTRQLAEIAGVERSAIVRLEADTVDIPKPDNLMKLADTLELNAADLFVLAGLPIPNELPSLAPYLRAKYDLPPEAVAEANDTIQKLLAKYDKPSGDAR